MFLDFNHQNFSVVTLRMSPTEEMFLSGGSDNTIRLWDLRVSTCQGVMNLPSSPIASFDPEGLVFGVGMNSDSIKLYDVRTFDKVRMDLRMIFLESDQLHKFYFKSEFLWIIFSLEIDTFLNKRFFTNKYIFATNFMKRD